MKFADFTFANAYDIISVTALALPVLTDFCGGSLSEWIILRILKERKLWCLASINIIQRRNEYYNY